MEKRRGFVSNHLPRICSAQVSVTAKGMEGMVQLVSRGPSCRGRQMAGRFRWASQSREGGPRAAQEPISLPSGPCLSLYRKPLGFALLLGLTTWLWCGF